MSMPLYRVKLDVASQYGVVEVVVLDCVRVYVTFEHLDTGQSTSMVIIIIIIIIIIIGIFSVA